MIKAIIILVFIIIFYFFFMMPLTKMASKTDRNIEQNENKNNNFPSESNGF